jgi:hypothetical protein
MTGVTSSTRAIHVGQIFPVNFVYRRLGMARAIRAHKNRIVRGIRVASGADFLCIPVIDAPQGVKTIGRTKPTDRRVASLTCSCESGSDVIWNRSAQRHGVLPIRGVATIAIRWRRSGTGVAKIACHGSVRAGQLEPSRSMVKGRA